MKLCVLPTRLQAPHGLYLVNYIPNQYKPNAWYILNAQHKFVSLTER